MIEILNSLVSLATSPDAVTFYQGAGIFIVSWLIKTYVPWASPFQKKIIEVIRQVDHDDIEFVKKAMDNGWGWTAKQLAKKLMIDRGRIGLLPGGNSVPADPSKIKD